MNIYKNIKSNNNINSITFVIIAIFYLFGNLLWYKLNSPIIVQGAYNNYFASALLEGKFFFDITPLIIWMMRGLLNIFGNEYFDLEIIFMNYFFFLMALYFINKICIEIKDKETGIIAMILFALTPCVYGASRQYGHHDYHVMCILLFNIYSLIKLENFSNRKWSIIYGISVGIGLLAKDTFLVYFFVPWLYVMVRSLIEKTGNNWSKTKNILITILFGCLVASCHYFSIETVIKILKDPFIEAHNPTYAFKEFRIFTTGVCEYMLSFPIFLLFLLGTFWYILKYKNTKYKYIFLLWLIVPWLVLINMPHHKHVDYGLGLVPAIIIIISLYITDIKKRIYKKILSIVLIVICLLQYISFSYGINIGLQNLKIHLRGYEFYYFDNNQRDVFYPNIVIYNHEKRDYSLSFLRYLMNNFNDKVIYMYKDMYTSFFTMEEISTLLRLQKCKIILNYEEILKSDIIIFSEKNSFIDSNYFFDILKQEFSEHFHDDKNLETDIKAKINEIKNNYIKLDEFSLADNAEEQDYMIILGKKDLFEKNNKLKYKYEYSRFNRFKINE